MDQQINQPNNHQTGQPDVQQSQRKEPRKFNFSAWLPVIILVVILIGGGVIYVAYQYINDLTVEDDEPKTGVESDVGEEASEVKEKIIFERNRISWIINSDGTEPEKMPESCDWRHISADRKKVACIASKEVDILTPEMRKQDWLIVLNLEDYTHEIILKVDSESIVEEKVVLGGIGSLRWLGNDSIIYFDIEDKNIKKISLEDGSIEQIPNTDSMSNFDISPDRTKLAASVTIRKGDKFLKKGIYLMDIDGTNLKQVTNEPYDWLVAFSPDNQKILFNRRFSGQKEEPSDIFTINIDGTDEIQLTHHKPLQGEYFAAIQWIPNSSKVLLESYDTEAEEKALEGFLHKIQSINYDGSDLTLIHKGGYRPKLSYNGEKIAFTASTGPNERYIYTMGLNSANLKRLTDLPREKHEAMSVMEYMVAWR